MMGVSEIAKSYEIIIVARFIVGICAGRKKQRHELIVEGVTLYSCFFVCRSVV